MFDTQPLGAAATLFAMFCCVPAFAPAQAQVCAPPDSLPKTVSAVRLHAYGGPEQLHLDSIPRPQAGPGEVLIKVDSASINPIDWKLREGRAQNWWPLKLPAVVGRDASGTVVALGAGVDDFHCGDAVVVLAESDSGTFAEYIVAAGNVVAPKPTKLSFVEAAAYPLVALTAWDGLVETGQVQAGERVLIHGGAGGVGSMAVQIAKARGAHVIATASARNREFLLGIGADEVIDYTRTRFEDAVDDVDLVFDTVGGDTLSRSPAVLVPGGRLVTIAGSISAQACSKAGIVCPPEKNGTPRDGLRQLGKLIDGGALRINVDAEYPLSAAGAAQERNREGHTRGKIVIRVAKDAI